MGRGDLCRNGRRNDRWQSKCSDAKSAPQLAFLIVDEDSRRHAESVGNCIDVVEADIALASFDRTDVGAVDAGQIRERFLRQPALLP